MYLKEKVKKEQNERKRKKCGKIIDSGVKIKARAEWDCRKGEIICAYKK